jgi:hypothetical protein
VLRQRSPRTYYSVPATASGVMTYTSPSARGYPSLRSQISAEAAIPSEAIPPMTRTRPSRRSVAVKSCRPLASEPAGTDPPVAGSKTSAETRVVMSSFVLS